MRIEWGGWVEDTLIITCAGDFYCLWNNSLNRNLGTVVVNTHSVIICVGSVDSVKFKQCGPPHLSVAPIFCSQKYPSDHIHHIRWSWGWMSQCTWSMLAQHWVHTDCSVKISDCYYFCEGRWFGETVLISTLAERREAVSICLWLKEQSPLPSASSLTVCRTSKLDGFLCKRLNQELSGKAQPALRNCRLIKPPGCLSMHVSEQALS